MNLEFETFKTKILSSLAPNVPLQDNLRALMTAVLTKFKVYSRASLALHVLSNPDVEEHHVLVLGSAPETQRAVNAETKRRGQPGNVRPDPNLPCYLALHKEGDAYFPTSPNSEWLVRLDGALFELLQKIKEDDATGRECQDYSPARGDLCIVIPLARGRYRRLGHIVLCAPDEMLLGHYQNAKEQEDRALFRQDIADLLIRVFSNFYHMAPDTYLPSYYLFGEKAVTLLCAEMRGFDRFSEKLEVSGGLSLLNKLLSKFCEIAAKSVEDNKGRVDQMWGNGMVAVFGEHLDSSEPRYQQTGFKRALTAAVQFVQEFDPEAQKWIRNEVGAHDVAKFHYDHVSIRPAVAIDHARVFFDYAGSHERKVYMAVGDRVNFVKQLAAVTGQVVSTVRGLDPMQAAMMGTKHPSNISWDPGIEGAPILLSKSAHELAPTYLKPMSSQTPDMVQKRHFISLPGRIHEVPVFAVWPENLALTAAAAQKP